MKILAHIHAYPPNHNAGAEWMVHHMFKWLQARGHEITVMVSDPGAKEFEEIPIIPEFGPTHDIRKWYRWADIVVSHLVKTGKAINNIRIVDKPACFVMHNTHHNTMIDLIAHRSILCFNSHYTQDVPFYKGKESCIVYPPCPVEYYRTNRGGARYVTLINYALKKGGPLFYRMAMEMPEVDFLAVKGDYYPQSQRRLDNVTFKENTPKIQKEYALTKVLLMPSEYESFGRTAIEAAASGIPTIAAPTPGLKESLGEAGLFYDIKDYEGWKNEITHLLSDKEYYKERAEMARARAKELEGMVDSQMRALESLMHKAIKGKTKEVRAA
jgi:glycosyltransferase involved in cell wall biosynthesis